MAENKDKRGLTRKQLRQLDNLGAGKRLPGDAPTLTKADRDALEAVTRLEATSEQFQRAKVLTSSLTTRTQKGLALSAECYLRSCRPGVKRERNRMQEQVKTAQKRATAVVELRRQREDGEWNELLQVAQALIVCSLPYQRTTERQLVRRARAADGSEVVVTFTATDPDVELPYGSDRTLLHWLVDRAIRADQPFVAWDTAIEFLRDAGLSDHGKNFRDLRDRFDRLSSVAITVTREQAGRKRRLVMPIIEESNLPSSVDLRAEARGERRLLDEAFGFKLNARFWSEVKERHVPVPWELIRQTRKQSQLQDFMLWIYWRSYAARGQSRVPLEVIREQFGIMDSNPWRLKQQIKDAYQALRFIDPAFPGEVEGDFIQVVPYRGFLPGGEDRKSLR